MYINLLKLIYDIAAVCSSLKAQIYFKFWNPQYDTYLSNKGSPSFNSIAYTQSQMYQAAGETNVFQKKDAEESRPAWI